MTKIEQLTEYTVRDIIEVHVIENDLDVKEAMTQFYESAVFEKLNDSETQLYLCGSAYVYDLFRDELEYSQIVQKEI